MRLALVLAIAGSAISVWAGSSNSLTAEDEFKAALVISFAQYTEWPAQSGPLLVCFAGRAELAPVAERAAAGKTVAGRSLFIRILKSPAEARSCHVLYISGPSLLWLEGARPAGLLTIGDDSRFLARGGHVGLFQEDGRFSFETDASALRQAGLTISSKLLRLGYVRHGRTREAGQR